MQQSTNESPSKPARFVVQPLHVFAQRPSPTWIVKRILPRAEVALIIGESGAGKSFVAFDLAAAIVRGVDWRQEFHTAKGQVVYVVAEGASFFHQRAVAYARHHDLSLDALQMGVVSDTPNLLLKEDVKSLAQQLKAFGKTDVVIIDTFAQVTPGGNENSGEDMGRALAHCKTLHRATGAVVLLVHHIGKDESKGARGWSGIKAAADAELTIARRDPMRTITVSKMKDGPDGLVLPFKLVDVEIDKDEEGEAIKSCIVHHLEEAQDARPVRQPQGVNACAVWEAVQNLTALDPNTTVDDVITMAAAEIIHDPKKKHDRRREMARQALVGLQTLGYVDVSNGIVTMAGKE